MIKQVSFLTKIWERDVKTLPFEEVIASISSEKYASEIQHIREVQETEKQSLKQELLPAFFPTVHLGNDNKLDDFSSPTGIIQFDIELKDNPECDFISLRKEIQSFKETYYLFNSPSGGLKFGILTDFNKHDDEDLESVKERYKLAYSLTKDSFTNQLKCQFDDSVGNLKWACYLSSDKEAYFNPHSLKYIVDSKCIYSPPNFSISMTFQPLYGKQVEDLLNYVPKDYRYTQRLPVNFAVMSEIGRAAVPLLYSHWTTVSRKKLMDDLESQCRLVEQGKISGNIGVLVNIAKQNGWIPPKTGKQRKQLQPQQTDFKLNPLLSPEEAEKYLIDIINAFFVDKKSRFINFSTGAGKTYTLIKVLEQLGLFKKILLLVKTHELAEEIKEKFSEVRRERTKNLSDIERLKDTGKKIKVALFRGRNELCEYETKNNEYKKAGIPMPADQCSDCWSDADCRYIEQFNRPLQNVRIMTHNEYFNQPSKYFSGTDASGKPRKRGWVPEFIIIDENVFEKEQDFIETSSSRLKSIRMIIHAVFNGENLKVAVKNNCESLFQDSILNKKQKKPLFKNSKQYITAINNIKNSKYTYSPILRNLLLYVSSEDESYLHGMRVNKNGDALLQSIIKPISKRHQGIPTLYLDATANESVIKAMLPDVEFISINVKTKPDINLYQLSNITLTQEYLSDEKNLETVINGLSNLLKKYKNPGLITYMNPKINDNSFDKYLSEKIGITHYTHFGNLRGINKFSDVDCLIILGRYCINLKVLEEYTYAIFNRPRQEGREYLDSPVRMKDGSVKLINSQINGDSITRAVSDHFSQSETLQAIGRGRMVYGSPKDIYYLSNEYIGPNIEVTGFLKYEDIFSEKYLNKKILEHVSALGYIRDVQRELIKHLGLTTSEVEKHREQIKADLIHDGFVHSIVKYTDKYRTKKEATYFIKDEKKLEEYLKLSGFKKILIET